MNRERDYLEFQQYLENKRQNLSPGLGHMATNLLIAPIGMGVVEASEPRATYVEKQVTNETLPSSDVSLRHEIGLRTLRQTVYLDYSPRSALSELSRTELRTAA